MNTILSPTPSYQSQPRNSFGHRLFSWFKWGLLGVLFSLVGLVVIGAIYQAVATARDVRAFPMPGQLIEVGAHQLHLYCVGPTNSDKPTVILESGLGGTSSVWAWIQPEVAKTVRVCAYDRAGMGWSEPSAEERDAQHIAEELHTLLHNADVATPYVLAGWSYGGLYARVYADRYHTEVAGVVLLDSSSPDQCTSTAEGKAQCNRNSRIYQIAPALARIGAMRLSSLFQPASGLPEPQNSELSASFAATKDWTAQSAEFLASPPTNAQVRASTIAEGLPLFVLTATDHSTPPELEQLWQGWQREMAALSSNSVHRVVSGASHTSLVFDAEHAEASTAAILQVVEAAHSGMPLLAY